MAKQMSANMKDPGVQVLRISRASDEWEPKDGVTLVNGNVLTKTAVKYLEEFGITVPREVVVPVNDMTIEECKAELAQYTRSEANHRPGRDPSLVICVGGTWLEQDNVETEEGFWRRVLRFARHSLPKLDTGVSAPASTETLVLTAEDGKLVVRPDGPSYGDATMVGGMLVTPGAWEMLAEADEVADLQMEILKTTTDALVAEQDKSRALEYLVRAYEAMCPAYVRDVARKAAEAGLRMLALHAVRQVVVDAQQDAGGG
jgi:hypothetical protein